MAQMHIQESAILNILSSENSKTGTEIENPKSKRVAHFEVGWGTIISEMNIWPTQTSDLFAVQLQWVVPCHKIIQADSGFISRDPCSTLVVFWSLHQEDFVILRTKGDEDAPAQHKLLFEECAQVISAIVDQ